MVSRATTISPIYYPKSAPPATTRPSAHSRTLTQQQKQQRHPHHRRHDPRRQPAAEPRRLRTQVAPVVLTSVLPTEQIVAILAHPPGHALAAIALRRSIVVDVDGLHPRLGRALQIR